MISKTQCITLPVVLFAALQGIIQQAGLSRIYGGLHYRFDVEAGQRLGSRAAALALAGRLER